MDLLFLAWMSPVLAAPPALLAPIAGRVGEDVWISSRPDVDPGAGHRDHTGGTHTYDGHRGTDFAVAGSREALATWVLAPVGGKVLRVRNDAPDGAILAGDTSSGQECGNGVVLDAGDGWEVQLCHLALGTVRVRAGEVVSAGGPLGRVGWSGNADHPHVHVGVRKDGREVDPFSGKALLDGAPLAPGPLWAVDLPAPSDQDALAWVGFRPGPKNAGLDWPIDTGLAVIPANASSIVLEVFTWRPEKGDVVQTVIRSPEGTVSRGQVVQDRARPRQIWRIEKSWPEEARATGVWTADVTWRRGDRVRRLRSTVVVR